MDTSTNDDDRAIAAEFRYFDNMDDRGPRGCSSDNSDYFRESEGGISQDARSLSGLGDTLSQDASTPSGSVDDLSQEACSSEGSESCSDDSSDGSVDSYDSFCSSKNSSGCSSSSRS